MYFGLHWSDADARFFDIDAEEGVPLKIYDTAQAFFEAVLDEADDGPSDLLRAIFAAARKPLSEPVSPVPPSGPTIVATQDGAPPSPWEPHHEALGPATRATRASAAGRRVLWHQALAYSGVAAGVAIADDGGLLAVEITEEPYGVSMHPTMERALISTGVPGPLLELDLETATWTKLHDDVGWSCGFIDAEHVVTFTKHFGPSGHPGRLDLFRYTSGEALVSPIATIESGGNNAFVIAGRCYVTGVDGRVAIYERDGDTLARVASCEVIDGRLFAVADVVEHDGATWMAARSGTDPIVWFRVDGL